MKYLNSPKILLLVFWSFFIGVAVLFFRSCGEELHAQTTISKPWENMGNSVNAILGICAGGTAATDYEWGITYNNNSPIIRVTCTTWDAGARICTYPPYPTGDAEPFTWGGACWISNTNSTWDDACSAYHCYYRQKSGNTGMLEMYQGNGCNNIPTVWRRKL